MEKSIEKILNNIYQRNQGKNKSILNNYSEFVGKFYFMLGNIKEIDDLKKKLTGLECIG